MQAYFDQMSSLLFEKDLRASEEDSEVRTLARARTLTMISRLDPSHKVDVMRFLEEASLIQGVEGRGPIIRLTGADLSDADLSGADLNGAYLSNADLSRANVDDANLRWATLSNANLSNATLHDADLYFADLSDTTLSNAYLTDAQITVAGALEGATMPNGHKYEDWLKSKRRGEGEEAALSNHSRQTPTSQR
jgi:Pentapeptide repeats (8 copies)